MHHKRRRVFWVVVALCAVLLFYFRTWIHSPVMFVYTRPALIQAVAVWLVLHLYMHRWDAVRTFTYKDQQGKRHQSTFRLRWLSYVVLVALLTVALIICPDLHPAASGP